MRGYGYILPGILLSLCLGCGSSDRDDLAAASLAPNDTVAETQVDGPTQRPDQSDAPVEQELQKLLTEELDRLGKDEKTPAAAPSGAANAAFDLVVSYRGWRTGATLHWTERFIGDYDMNGLVNSSDLTPISQRWKYTVDHLPLAQAGIDYWPAGHPRNGGFSGILNGYPGWNTPADQWRTARVDGDDNGEINSADITPIAQHWHERLDSFRVYRKGPEDDDFVMLRLGIEDTFSIARSAQFPKGRTQPDNAWPYRMHYADVTVDDGYYEYYLAPFDSLSGEEGTPSAIVGISFDKSQPLPPPPPDNKPPLINVTANVTSGEAPLRVDFDASESSDPDGEIVLYIWDWEGDGQVDATSQNDPLAYHVYEEPGWFYPELTVVDDFGGFATETIEIEVGVSSGGIFPPKVELLTTQPMGQRPHVVNFSPTGTDDTGTQLTYEWDFDGDGTVDSAEEPQNGFVTHTYDVPGLYVAWLWVSNGLGLSSFDNVVITVLDNTDPVATLEADVSQGIQGLTVQFDASASSDADGDDLNYAWDFEGDGTFIIDEPDSPFSSYTYEVPGSYTATVQVADEANAKSFASVQIDVAEDPNENPVAVIWAEHQSFPTGERISLHANDSYDPDGSIETYSWDLDDDGVFETSGASKSIRFDEPGSYRIELVVSDEQNALGFDEIQFDVFDNAAPQAVLTADVLEGMVPLAVNFDASASSDPQGDELSFRWQFTDGGSSFTGGDKESTIYENVGRFTCTVTVEDSWGLKDSASVIVQAAMPPVAGEWYLTAIDKGYADHWSPGLDMEVVDGKPAIAYSAAEQGAWLGQGETRYIHAQDANGLGWEQPRILMTPAYNGDGALGASLSLINGSPAVAWARHSGFVQYRQAADAAGNSWNQTVTVHQISGTGGGVELVLFNGKPSLAWMNSLEFLMFARASDADGQSWNNIQQLENVGGGFNFQPGLEDVNGELCMAFADNASPREINYRKATDNEASGWNPPQQIEEVDGSSPSVAFTVIGGIPMVAYYCNLGLVFQVAPGGLSLPWSSPVILTSEGAGQGSWFSEEFCIAELEGKPAVVDKNMGIWRAGDLLGSSWSGPEHVPGPYEGDTFMLREVNDQPAMAFQQHNTLYYAVKLAESP